MADERKRKISGPDADKNPKESESKVRLFVENMAGQIVKAMENCGSWEKTWNSPVSEFPYNVLTQHRYSGMNWLVLAMTEAGMGYSDHRWLTISQLKKFSEEHGFGEKPLRVKKGEKGTHILYPSRIWHIEEDNGDIRKVTEREAKELIAANGGKLPDNVHCRIYFRGYTVFNACQIPGFPAEDAPAACFEMTPESRNRLLDDFVEYSGIKVEFGEYDPCYDIARDRVLMPFAERFFSADEFYLTQMHEVFHATRSPQRENRKGEYAFEEMRAEIFSLMVGRHFKLSFSMDNAAAYIKSWNRRFSHQEALSVFKAAGEAMRVFQYLADFSQGIKPDAEWLPDIPQEMLARCGRNNMAHTEAPNAG